MSDQITANKRRSALLVAAFVLLVGLVASALLFVVGLGVIGLVVAFLLAAGAAFASYWYSDKVALSMTRAAEADEPAYARLHNVVEGLCIAAGVPKPRLYVVEDGAPNAFATGRSPRHAALVVTTGLLDKLNRIELEGVLAHELAHVKNYDILLSTLAVTVGLVSPRLAQQVLGPGREAMADISGVALTRYPPGLISALEKLRDDSAVVGSASRATAHLWIEAPTGADPSQERRTGLNRLFNTHPPLDERIEALREL